MSLQRAPAVFTPEEYLALERPSEIRHEFLDGTVYAMAGESPTHSAICFNLAAALGAQLRGTNCRGFSPNMKVRAGESGLYAYPDLEHHARQPDGIWARAALTGTDAALTLESINCRVALAGVYDRIKFDN